MKAYKRFDKDMKCSGFQYHEGETYHEDTAELGKSGFHACEMPLDVLDLYPTVYLNIFREVELDEVSQDRNNYNTEVCAKTIRIGTEIGISGLAKAQIEYIESEYIKSRSAEFIGEYATRDHGAASATGNFSAASATGFHSVASATGCHSAASATGYKSVASATGCNCVASVTGDNSAASATGNHSAALATGYEGAAYATGNYSTASATGKYSAASATGKASVAMACGVDGRVMGGIGCALVAVERGVYDRATGTFPIVSVAAGIVDGENIKPGVWYICKGGKLVEI